MQPIAPNVKTESGDSCSRCWVSGGAWRRQLRRLEKQALAVAQQEDAGHFDLAARLKLALDVLRLLAPGVGDPAVVAASAAASAAQGRPLLVVEPGTEVARVESCDAALIEGNRLDFSHVRLGAGPVFLATERLEGSEHVVRPPTVLDWAVMRQRGLAVPDGVGGGAVAPPPPPPPPSVLDSIDVISYAELAGLCPHGRSIGAAAGLLKSRAAAGVAWRTTDGSWCFDRERAREMLAATPRRQRLTGLSEEEKREHERRLERERRERLSAAQQYLAPVAEVLEPDEAQERELEELAAPEPAVEVIEPADAPAPEPDPAPEVEEEQESEPKEQEVAAPDGVAAAADELPEWVPYAGLRGLCPHGRDRNTTFYFLTRQRRDDVARREDGGPWMFHRQRSLELLTATPPRQRLADLTPEQRVAHARQKQRERRQARAAEREALRGPKPPPKTPEQLREDSRRRSAEWRARQRERQLEAEGSKLDQLIAAVVAAPLPTMQEQEAEPAPEPSVGAAVEPITAVLEPEPPSLPDPAPELPAAPPAAPAAPTPDPALIAAVVAQVMAAMTPTPAQR